VTPKLALDLEAKDTITALLTGSSDGVVAIVRISGPRALELRDRLFHKKRAGAHRAAVMHLGHTLGEDGKPLGEALCVTFPDTASYTGEPCVELHGFGGRINAQRLLAAVLALGARQARPGEFTLRAYLHGKLSLDQAEAVGSLVAAQSVEAARQAESARSGGLTQALEPLREGMLSLLAETEAYLDFPEDGLPAARMEAQRMLVTEVMDQLRGLLTGHTRSRRLLEGARVVLWGAPNAGKSTLMNALCGEGRSIVDATPGTTRDVIESRVVWEGMPLTLLDTAGVREAQSNIEREGVRRSLEEARKADLVLHCVARDSGVQELQDPPTREPPIVVETKADLAGPARPLGADSIRVSAVSGEGMTLLRTRMMQRLTAGGQAAEGGVVAATARQAELLETAHAALKAAVASREEQEPEEVVADHFRRAANAVGEVSGRHMPAEEVLGAIFSRFCIGK